MSYDTNRAILQRVLAHRDARALVAVRAPTTGKPVVEAIKELLLPHQSYALRNVTITNMCEFLEYAKGEILTYM
jgi:hypothetical protein